MSSDLQLRLTRSSQQPYTVHTAIEGDVEIAIDAPQSHYKKIVVALVGKAEVYFFHHAGDNFRHFQQSDCFLQLHQVLWERDSASSNVLAQGAHSFPFRFALEDHCAAGTTAIPSSMEGKDGRIRYVVEAKLVRGLESEIEAAATQVRIPITNIVGINRPDLLAPRSVQKDLTVSGLFCVAGGTISVTATISRSGYCIGNDKIPVSIEIDNSTGRRLLALSVELVRRDICRANGQPSLTLSILGSQVNTHLPSAGISFSWNTPAIEVPDTDTTLTNCAIVQVHYYIRVSFRTKYSTPQELVIPIILGNVPFDSEGEEGHYNYAPTLSSIAHQYEPPPLPRTSDNESPSSNRVERQPLLTN